MLGKAAPHDAILLASTRAALTRRPPTEVADLGLFENGGELYLAALAGLSDETPVEHVGPVPEGGLRLLAALVRAASIAGAAGALLDRTVRYANERVQFGRAIGKQQAVQQQLAVMAEQCVDRK